jgi:hypothetical protein
MRRRRPAVAYNRWAPCRPQPYGGVRAPPTWHVRARSHRSERRHRRINNPCKSAGRVVSRMSAGCKNGRRSRRRLVKGNSAARCRSRSWRPMAKRQRMAWHVPDVLGTTFAGRLAVLQPSEAPQYARHEPWNGDQGQHHKQRLGRCPQRPIVGRRRRHLGLARDGLPLARFVLRVVRRGRKDRDMGKGRSDGERRGCEVRSVRSKHQGVLRRVASRATRQDYR